MIYKLSLYSVTCSCWCQTCWEKKLWENSEKAMTKLEHLYLSKEGTVVNAATLRRIYSEKNLLWEESNHDLLGRHSLARQSIRRNSEVVITALVPRPITEDHIIFRDVVDTTSGQIAGQEVIYVLLEEDPLVPSTSRTISPRGGVREKRRQDVIAFNLLLHRGSPNTFLILRDQSLYVTAPASLFLYWDRPPTI